ncbi:MAG TPA: sulfite exporter TauE/SafE family protein [Candidatus Saccharimonadales bacterium]|nr:sulfite exporter TauE/SafE family protein [Candidatus Saccharimonadales bacterium]
MDVLAMILYSILGGVIGFIGGMVGLVLGVIRFPFILEAETSASITAGTNLSISTLGAISGAINHYRQNNVDLKIFLVMALSGALGAFVGSFLTNLVSIVFLVSIIIIIVSCEASDLMIKSGKVGKKVYKNSSTNPTDSQSIDKRLTAADYDSNKTRVNSINKKKNIEIIKEMVIGLGVGLLGGMVGLVLGSIRMPAMISILKLPARIAIGTNLASSAFMGTVGVIGHLINNNIDFVILTLMVQRLCWEHFWDQSLVTK